MTEPPILAGLLTDELAALWLDRDVERIWVYRQGGIRLRRRGRRELLDVHWPEALWRQLDQVHPHDQPVASVVMQPVELPPHHAMLALEGSRVVGFYLEKAPALAGPMHEFEEQGICGPGLVDELLGAILAGESVLVLGLAGFLVDRFVWSLAAAASAHSEVMPCTSPPASWSAPVLTHSGDPCARARVATALGAEVLVATGLAADALTPWMAEVSTAASLVGLRAASASAFGAGGALAALRHRFGRICVCAYDAAGRPRILPVGESPGWRDASSSPSSPVQSGRAGSHPASPHPPDAREPPAVVERPAPAWDALPPLEALPPGPPPAWTSHAPDDDPGWELAEAGHPPASADASEASALDSVAGAPLAPPGAFARVLADVGRRPTYTPRPPSPHPQARRLQSDPFGGLTLEPPRDPEGASTAGEPAYPDHDIGPGGPGRSRP